MAFDPAKAALYNQLVRQGLSSAAAAAQAGIGDDDGNYEIDEIGTPATNPNFGTIQQGGADMARRQLPQPPKPTAEQLAEDAATEAELNPPPGSRNITSSSYTTTSTVTVSGGGSTTITAGPKVSTAGSEAVQPAINAKQAEIDAFNKDNPSPFARKKQGLPPLTPEENEARIAKQSELNDQRTALVNGQTELKASTPPTVTTVPNTTTTIQTVTTGTTGTDQAVNSIDDQQLAQQTETQLASRSLAPNANTAAAAAPVAAQTTVDEFGQVVEADAATPVTPEELGNDYGFTSEETAGADAVELGEPEAVDDPFEQSRLDAEAEINDNPIDVDPADVDPADDPFEAERLEREQELNRQELAEQTAEPAAVTDDPTVYPTDEETIAQDAQQAANRAQLQAADAQEAAAQQAVTLDKARAQNTIANQRSNKNNGDWRVKLRLAPLADYLYMAKPPGILAPLAPDGVIFPYTPTIQTTYKANYATTDITHSNYKGYFYQGSSVEPFTISCPFTAQSTSEAEYLLAVIHFFKSVTKMFYGQDPQRGTPPPLVYLTGLGEFQFNEHPCVVTSFTYDLPADVDYIRAYSPNVNNSNMLQQRQSNNSTGPGTSWGNGILGGVLGGAVNRLASSKLFNGQPLPKGGQNIPPAPQTLGSSTIPTYVPTKMTISISLLPVTSRQAQSQRFSVRQYATGDLLKGGMW
jgi:hypothetical protein